VRQLEAAGISGVTNELKFHPVRRWRFDLALPAAMLAIEVDGGVWTSGRHTRGAGFIADCEKCNEAILLGWRVLRFPGDHIKSGIAIETIKKALAIPPTTIVH
jgi:very-short-patch-repair endonuclease